MSARRFWRDLHNIIFKIKYKLYTASGSAPSPLPQRKIVGAPLHCHVHFSPSPLLTASAIHPAQALPFHFFTTIFNIIFPSDTTTVCKHDCCKTRDSSIMTRKASLYSTLILWWRHPVQFTITTHLSTSIKNETFKSPIAILKSNVKTIDIMLYIKS